MITKADILTAVKARTGRTTLTDIDSELTTVLMEVSALVAGAVEKTGTVTIAAAGSSIAAPSDFIKIINAANASYPSMKKITFGELMNYRAASNSSGLPYAICEFSGDIYVWPPATAETEITLYYQYQESDPDSIGLDDVCQEALIEGVCHKIELGLGVLGEITAETVTHHTFYQQQIQLLQEHYKK